MTAHLPALPPNDRSAEEAVIAAMLLDEDAFYRVVDIIDPADFFAEEHRWCYEACIKLAERGEPITIPTLAHELDRAGRLDAAGGEPWIVEVCGRHYTAQGVEAHARIVVRDATYRRLIQASHQVATVAYRGGPDLDAVLDEARALLDGVQSREQRGAVVDAATALQQMRERPTARYITSGYASLDRVTGGLALGQLSIVGARTDNGKTALCNGMGVRMANAGVPVVYVPLEDSRDEVLTRMVDHLAGASPSYVRQTALTRAERERYEHARRDAEDRLTLLPVYFPDEGRTPVDIEGLRTTVAMAVRRYGAVCAVIDHIDALPIDRSARRGQSDAAVVAEWMRELKALAIRLGIHVVVASQVNREADSDTMDDPVFGAMVQTPPRMHRLKESGAKEQAAQLVMMVGKMPATGHDEPLRMFVEKVKGYTFGRYLLSEDGGDALAIDRRAGAVYEADRPGPPPEAWALHTPEPAEQGALLEMAP